VLADLAEQLGVQAQLGYDEVEQTGRPLEVPPLIVVSNCQFTRAGVKMA
jgi:hypothetical protein